MHCICQFVAEFTMENTGHISLGKQKQRFVLHKFTNYVCTDGHNSIPDYLFFYKVKSTELQIFYMMCFILPELIKHAHPIALELRKTSEQCFLVYK